MDGFEPAPPRLDFGILIFSCADEDDWISPVLTVDCSATGVVKSTTERSMDDDDDDDDDEVDEVDDIPIKRTQSPNEVD